MSDSFDAYHKWLGIRPEEQPPNHYRLLGVAPFESDPDVLASAADQRMAHLRTFQNGPHRDVCHVVLNHIATARICLLDTRKKEAYDLQLRGQIAAKMPEPPPAIAPCPDRPLTETAFPGSGSVEPAPVVRRRRLSRHLVIQAVGLGVSVLVCLAAITLLINWSGFENEVPPELPGTPLAQSPPEKEPDPPQTVESPTSPQTVESPTSPQTVESPTSPQTVESPASPFDPLASQPDQAAHPSEPAAETLEEPSREGAPTSPKPSDAAPEPAIHPTIVLTPPDARAPVPSEAALAEAFQAVREVYDADYEAARGVERKQALAVKLLQKAEETRNDLPGRMMLLKLVMEVAGQAGDRRTMFQAIDALNGTFQVDGLQMKGEILDAFSAEAETATERDWIVQQAMPLIDQALAVDRFEMAADFARLATVSAGTSATAAAADPVPARTGQIEQARQAFDGAQRAIAALAANAADEEANLTLGKYLCLFKGDWERGLPLLAKGSDPALRELAAQEQTGASTPDAHVRLGDAWWDLGEKETGTARKQLWGRAGYRYRQALPGLHGLTEDRVAKRLAALATTLRITFTSPTALNQFILAQGPGRSWKFTRGKLYIRGDRASTTFSTYFKSISAVTIVGGIVLPDTHNFRVSVGRVNAILNWEEADQNHFRYGENLPPATITRPSVLVPGRVHSIQFRQDGRNVVLSVDGKPHFTAPGTLEGTVTIYPAASAIMIREMTIEGEPDLLKSVTGPSHNNLY